MPKNTTPQPDPEADAQQAPESTGTGATDTDAPSTDAPPTPPPAAPLAGNRFFAWMRSLGIVREPGWIGGVAAGIAARLGVDPLLVRGIAVVVAVLGGPALLLYAAGWLLLPDRNDKIHLEEVFRGRLDSPIAGIGALILLSMLPVTQGFWFAGNAFWGEPFWGASVGRALWTVVLLGGIVWFVVWVARRSQRADGVPVPVPATTDGRPETIPQPSTTSAATATTAVSPGARPPAPDATASAEEFAAWRAQQAQWKAENDAFRARQASEQRAASMAAQEQYRAERAARRAVEAAHHARTRSNPLFSFVFIGASFVVGGIVTLVVGGGQILAAGLLAGLGAMLAVLAVAIIVNGARGRRPGGSQGVAAIVLTTLIVAAFVPHGPNISYDSDARFAPEAGAEGFAANAFFVGFGDARLDLRSYFDAPAAAADPSRSPSSSNVTLTVGVGDTTVYLPADEYIEVDLTTVRGEVSTPGLAPAGNSVSGRFSADFLRYGPADDPDWTTPTRTVYLRIISGDGDVTIIRTPSTEAGTN